MRGLTSEQAMGGGTERKHPAPFKANLALAELAEDKTPVEPALQFGALPSRTIDWKRRPSERAAPFWLKAAPPINQRIAGQSTPGSDS